MIFLNHTPVFSSHFAWFLEKHQNFFLGGRGVCVLYGFQKTVLPQFKNVRHTKGWLPGLAVGRRLGIEKSQARFPSELKTFSLL